MKYVFWTIVAALVVGAVVFAATAALIARLVDAARSPEW